MKTPKRYTVSKTQLAAIVGVSLTTLTNWQHRGLPFVAARRKGEPNRYEPRAVIASMIIEARRKTGPDVNEERAKLAAAQTESAALRNIERRAGVISVETAREVATRAAVSIRRILEASPMKSAELAAVLVDVDSLGALDFTNQPAGDDDDGAPQ